jgi:DNA-binding transcriptional LysR family regulator
MGKRISLRIQVGSFDAVCRMVEAGAGIAIVPNSCARRYASRKVLRFIRLEDDWARRELRLVRRPAGLPQFAEHLIQSRRGRAGTGVSPAPRRGQNAGRSVPASVGLQRRPP